MPWSKILRGAGAALLALAGACADPPTGSRPSAHPGALGAIRDTAEAYLGGRPEFPSIPRVGLALRVVGPLRPGVPIRVRARAIGNRAARNVRLALTVLDTGGTGAAVAAHGRAPRVLERTPGALGAGAEDAWDQQVVFAQPGYYRVVVRATSDPATTGQREAEGDTTVLNAFTETLYVLVDERGGRVTAGFDPQVTLADSTRILLYGAYGPFIARPAAPAGTSMNRLPTGGSAQRDGSAAEDGAPRVPRTAVARYFDGYIRGRVQYYHDSLGTSVPLGNVELVVRCTDPYRPTDPAEVRNTFTQSDGTFVVYCSPIRRQYTVEQYLRSSVADVRGRENTPATYTYSGGSFDGYGDYWDPVIEIGNRYAAHVFATLNRRAPLAFSRFNRSRGRILVYAADADPNYGIFYWGDDHITTNYRRIFGQDGEFVTVHEYGHGFQQKAIDPWGDPSIACTNNEHFWDETETHSCAFREGFADFFSVWLQTDALDAGPYGGDVGLENNYDVRYGDGSTRRTNPPTGGDGVRVESAIAAFLYDLVDDGSELDGSGNTVGPAEPHDPISVPASWLADVLYACAFDGPTVTRLAGGDQLVYCLEGDLSARTDGIALARDGALSWRNYTRVRFERTLPRYDKAAIRRLWRYNMYGAP